MLKTKSEADLLDILRSLLRESLRLQSEGGSHARLSQAVGYVDGYVRALIETGVADHATLLAVVRDARAESRGAATRTLEAETEREIAAA
jgi:hypothetical protein